MFERMRFDSYWQKLSIPIEKNVDYGIPAVWLLLSTLTSTLFLLYTLYFLLLQSRFFLVSTFSSCLLRWRREWRRCACIFSWKRNNDAAAAKEIQN